MRRLWKWASIGAGVLAGLALAGIAGVYFASQAVISRRYEIPPSHLRASKGPEAIARGARLARIYGCADCHTHSLQGAFIPDFGIASRNLTRLARRFSDADFDRAVRGGLTPSGTSVAEYMPSDAFQFMTDGDMADILAYVRSLRPEGRDIPFPAYGLKERVALLTGAAHMNRYWRGLQKPAMDLGPRFASGRLLAMSACGECHMTSLTGAPAFVPAPRPPDLSLVAAYAPADFARLMRAGKAAGGRELPLMSATARARFSHFTDAEIRALYDYLAARGRRLSARGS
ncbi:MAG TPA: cytochrome c [Rhizomicrobium sp.]|nr:cytochrome c [Rhizomicrobium sp.]